MSDLVGELANVANWQRFVGVQILLANPRRS
jgi:hypothetical protein